MTYTIYIKLTNDCNLHCRHCYNAMMHNRQYMDDDTLESSISAIRNFSNTHPDDIIDVQLHGGEPLLYDLEGLAHVVSSLQCEKIRFGITSNLVKTDIDDKYIEFFRTIRPDGTTPLVTTSWDKDIRFGKTDEDTWSENVKKLINGGIKVQPIVCVTNLLVKNGPEDLFCHMNGLGIRNLNFERLTFTGRASDGYLVPTNREIDDWLYAAYILNQEFKFSIPIFDSVESSVNGFLLGCRARRCMKTVITINPDGTLAACPNTSNRTTGKVRDGVFEFDKAALGCMVSSEENRTSECLVCKFFKYCNGECCQLRFDKSGCPGLTKIYTHILSQKSS